MVQHGCVQGADAVHAAHEPVSVRRHHRADLLESWTGQISKTFPIAERYKLEFRFEAYNLTNSLMWANPNMTVGQRPVRPVHCPGHGNRGREMQYTLRLMF